MLRTINTVGMLCTAWFTIITINALVFMACESAAGVLYLISLAGFAGWLIFKAVLVIIKKEKS